MDERIVKKSLEFMQRRIVVARWPIEPWSVREAEYTPDQAYHYLGNWEELKPHQTFAALRTVFAKAVCDCPTPTTATGKLYLHFPGMEGVEGLLRVDGHAYAGLDANHDRVPVPGEGDHELEVEFISWLRAMCLPELLAERAHFNGGQVIEVDPDVEGAWYDLRVVADAIPYVSDERRRGRLSAALEEALLAIDFTLPRAEFALAVERGRWILQEQVHDILPDPEGGNLCLVGHTHIDTGWLWPVSETIRKCGRTFATAARLMEQYPDYCFSCSQPQLYAYTKEHYPELYDEIKDWVATGRWETTGAMWVESDCNVTSGESLIRQMMHGISFFENEFGTRPRVCWLPDVFGYPATLPAILSGCDVPYFMTCKLHWQSTNPFPNHLFWWEAPDGSRVLAHIPKLKRYYNGTIVPEELRVAWNNFRQKVEYDEVMVPFGYGDGGGGVTPEMMEYAARESDFPGLPATRVACGESYFDRVMDREPELPSWRGELYLETHRGTYTTQSRTKRANRKSELLLRDAEIASALAQMTGNMVDTDPLWEAWEKTLLHQFHDILPGSSIGQVYVDALVDYDQAQATALAVRQAGMAALAGEAPGDLVVFNALSWERSDPVLAVIDLPGTEADDDGDIHLVDAAGRKCTVQVLSRGNGQAQILFEPFAVPAVGWESFAVEPEAFPALDGVRAWDRGLENAMFRLELNDDGEITRLLDKRVGREVIDPETPANLWQLFQDGPEREAAWNIHATFAERQYAFTEPAQITVLEQGPVRASLRVEQRWRESVFSFVISLYKRTPRIDFVADVDWQARQTMLKIAFPVAVRSPEATCEIQFGVVERPTHRNTSWDQQKFEICAHHWVDLSEGGYGVSLLNDSRYGHDVKGNMLRLTALRGTQYPDPEADRGMHHFVYSLYPHPGDWRTGGTVRQGWELNVPLIPMTGRGEGEPTSKRYLAIEGDGLVLSAFKEAADGDGAILRVYEANGGHTEAAIKLAVPPQRVVATNFIEEDEAEITVEDDGFRFEMGPFEIKTFRIIW
jgi:alpha-mannosidase